MSDRFFAHHESGTTEIEFKHLGLRHYNLGSTILVAECSHMLLVAEGTPEAIIALGKELSAWGETFGNGRLTHTGVNTRREGLSRVRLLNWVQWHFDSEWRFAVGRPPEIEAALASASPTPARKRKAKQTVNADA